MFTRLKYYGELVRINKPIGTLLLMWPMLMALWVAAKGQPSFSNLIIFLLGCFLMRSAGCAINDFADRKLDALVERTQKRPLARGIINPIEALGIFMVCTGASFILACHLNSLALKWSVLAVSLAALYPFTKRFSYYPQFILGAAFATAIPMAFAAELNAVPFNVVFLYGATLLWAVAYDTQYAMVDREDDKKANIKSTAILWGRNERLYIFISYALMIFLLFLFGLSEDIAWPYYLSLGLVSLYIAYQHHLIKTRDKADCFRAFLNNNTVGMVLFLGVLFSYSF